MAAIVLSFALSVIVGASCWLLIGPRFSFNDDEKQNELLNVFAYVGIALPIVFIAVFWLVEEL